MRPLVLVHGFLSTRGSMWPLSSQLRRRGHRVYRARRPPLCIQDVRRLAVEVQASVADVQARTGAQQVDLVGVSQGGLAALYYVRRLGALVGVAEAANAYADRLQAGLDAVAEQSAKLPCRPRVYFEEWDEPRISGIQWVAELVRIAGGDDIFPELAAQSLARYRILADDSQIIARAPDIVFGSWCGKKFQSGKVAARQGWADVPAVRDGELHEVKSTLILQPGPAALTDGVAELARHIHRWAKSRG